MSSSSPVHLDPPPHASHRALRLGGIAVILLLAGAVLLAAALALWASHGSAVFFDLMAAGIAYCL
ncbi:hypothetical protein [Ancylobacter terrae]|uniref:hypothetical protein n=1 Tax=Ancylobacter sp. sgz301288 TaxID=3342077 RepID=UPI00386A2005